MRTYISVFIFLSNILLLCSCSVGGGRVMFDTTDQKADNRLEQILDTIQNNDQDALKAMFSKQALDEADDFDGSVKYLFGFFQGDVKSWKRERFMSKESVSYGKKSVIPITWYTVITDTHDYMFFIIDYIVNTIDPNCVGLYSLRVIRAEDEEREFAAWQDMKIPGIYVPESPLST